MQKSCRATSTGLLLATGIAAGMMRGCFARRTDARAAMDTLTCPKCRTGLSDNALDAEQCPQCGFPLVGPVVLVPAGSPVGGTRLLLSLTAALVLTGAGTIYALTDWSPQQAEPDPAPRELAALPIEAPVVVPVAPAPREVKPTNAFPPPVEPPGPVAVEPKKDVPRPIGVVMKVDPKIAPKRHFDHPDDTAALPDLNTGDRVTLTGRVRVLKLGSVNGKSVLDASGLVAEEVIITGDVDRDAQVFLNAPNGKVTVGGYVTGASKLTILAPGGEVVVAGSGRLSGCPVATVTAKRLEVKCPMSGTARISATLTAGGSLKLGLMEDGATVTYRKAAANDPPLTVEKGEMRGSAKVIAVD
jgi:hypothetical protein